jgi:catechol 2,3-dioxygenase-like lactoylglutathione lyase family enzyme
MKIRKIDHIGIIVQDMDAAKAFFLDLGLELAGEQDPGGEWVHRIFGLHGVKSSIAMLLTPDGGTRIELSKFHSPVDKRGVQPSRSNDLGIRHIAFVVEDLDAALAKIKKSGAELVGEVHNYKDVYKVCYIRGPEGILLELAEEIG